MLEPPLEAKSKLQRNEEIEHSQILSRFNNDRIS